MTVVCVPDEGAVELLGPVPDGTEVVVWDGQGGRAPGLDRVEFWVPQVEAELDLPTIFGAMPRLKVIQLLSAGAEDFVGQVPAGVRLCDARGVHGGAVADLVVLLLLAAQRRFPALLDSQRRGAWEPIGGDDLRDKRVVIVGAGELGEQTARRLKGFDAVPVMVASSARGDVHGTAELPELLPQADMVVLTLPLTAKTEGMVDAEFLARLSDGALLVNVARGKIIDTDALLAELATGRLRAALDVVDPEPLPKGHPLWGAPNLIVTPHVGGSVAKSGIRAFALVSKQLRQFVAGGELANVVEGDY